MAFPTTETHVSAAERALGVKLPKEYRERLMASNGGELTTAGDDWQVYPVFDATNRKTAGRSAGHIVLENARAREWEGFPKGAIAIASNGTGDRLVLLPLGTTGKLDPQIHLWDHETRKCKPVALRYDDGE
jgi:hypothetical protein